MRARGLLREYARTLSVVARTLDALAVVLAALAAYGLRFGELHLPRHYQIALVVGALLTLVVFPYFHVYQSWRGRSAFAHLRQVALAWAAVAAGLVILGTATKTSVLFSRHWMWMWGAGGFAMLLLFRLVLTYVLRLMRARGLNHRRALIVGTGRQAREIARRLRENPWVGIDLVGFVAENGGPGSGTLDGHPILGRIDRLGALVAERPVDEVWIALPLRAEERLQQILHELRHCTANIRYFPDLFGFRLLNHAVTEIAGLPVLDLSVTPMSGINRLVKAVEDRVLAAVILVLVSPLMLLIAIGVKLSSPGPVLFKQRRHGWDGRPIKVYKFRTMVVHEEPPGKLTQARRDDPRVTRFGAFLRRTSLDELPQFFNVLQGRMSIVGPRPHAVEHNEQYKELVEAYMLRHKVKPGITGWAQVNGWRGETDTIDKMRKRVEYDLYYIENWSLWFDLKIIFLTLFRGFVHRHAY
ncbi:undecaprenyl-phosphate glucose phosphotransferase [Inmirania thermothiophila]|uniref:Putative colanic acid biosynthesis UDP-glucose lipid carrier transferase n=1 Tax=Inmirania thermothiophila TaxID=1750597 RepID=A0A3N1YBV3_9GAMM|nr:undecaprenyl-phosphate glucose phosphotransferase [Inmirania thermothiophila]ROR35152.1 putative colanic acid biosynthesis UDP-glucose lipid carrier transferase [Inmirania thermothiophila]